MSSLDKYILRQAITPLMLIITFATMIVWMTQSLQRIEILVDNGQSIGVFFYLSLLIIPSLVVIIIPFAIFGAALYALNRLHGDSEIAVMFAAGVSRWRISAPLMLIAALGSLAVLYLNLDLMPRSYRTLKLSIANIRADVASTLLRSGEFSTVIDGFTIYVEEARPGGQFIGLLINDYRDGDNPETYMAERGVLRETDFGPVLSLLRGNIQRVNSETGEVSFYRFDQTAVNIASFREQSGQFQLELTERYLSELLNPDYSRRWDRDNAGKLVAEGHARLASPLYPFAYLVIALLALIGGTYSRRGYLLRIGFATAAVIVLRVAGFLTQNLAAASGMHWIQYALPGIVILVICYVLFRAPLSRKITTAGEPASTRSA